jgi:YggT family protein
LELLDPHPCRAVAQWLNADKAAKDKLMLALINTVYFVLDIYWWILVGSAVFSWLYAFNVVNSRNQVVASIGSMLFQLTEPVLRQIRRFMPDLGNVDISPIVALVAIYFLQQLLVHTIAPALLT